MGMKSRHKDVPADEGGPIRNERPLIVTTSETVEGSGGVVAAGDGDSAGVGVVVTVDGGADDCGVQAIAPEISSASNNLEGSLPPRRRCCTS
jgi:hypothetical protein